ncbi:MAG: hypothetical protein DME19_11235 [Verrucomicrobia bacterium]|nr:MAG: hypothetical protein DME19_11235 [Verrucomicrobiota bacterium]
MTFWTLIFRSLRFHARAHLGALLGAAVGSAVLIGALVVGDSVRGSLRDMALARLGAVQLALAANDRFFRAALADELAHKGLVEGMVVPLIALPATASAPDDSARANRVQLLGVDDRFWRVSEQPASFNSPAVDEVILNQPLAAQLGAKTGDRVVLRVARPGRLSREAPISPQEDSSVSLRLKVSAVASDAEFGRFSLQSSQLAPFNAFVSLTAIQDALKLPGRANLLLASTDEDPWAAVQANVALRQTWKLADAELELRDLPLVNALELRTSRVFLDPPVADAALKAATNATGILTYFVNELRIGDRAAPYSMVTAMGAPVVPPEMRDDEILINQWLADDLNAKPGDKLVLSYYVIGLSRRLEERTHEFTVRAVVPLSGAAADRSLMPEFPGLEKAESTRDWDPSLPVKLERIRTKDEDYWKKYRGTPKAFLTLAAGQSLWASRFGNLTSVRYGFRPHLFSGALRSVPLLKLSPDGTRAPTAAPLPEATTAAPMAGFLKQAGTELEKKLVSALNPASIGLSFEPVRQQALAAAEQSQDFGGLFLGFSFFLITAALLLMALLFQLGIEQRATEVGTLLALGFTPRQVRRLWLFEGGALALVGGVIGAAGGVGYARALLLGLSTLWRAAVQTSALRYHAEAQTLAIGAVAAVLVAWLTIWLALRKQAQQPARELLAEGAGAEFPVSRFPFPKKRSRSGLVDVRCGIVFHRRRLAVGCRAQRVRHASDRAVTLRRGHKVHPLGHGRSQHSATTQTEPGDGRIARVRQLSYCEHRRLSARRGQRFGTTPLGHRRLRAHRRNNPAGGARLEQQGRTRVFRPGRQGPDPCGVRSVPRARRRRCQLPEFESRAKAEVARSEPGIARRAQSVHVRESSEGLAQRKSVAASR